MQCYYNICMLYFHAFSEVQPIVPPVFDDAIPMGNFERLEIPLKRINNLFLIEARIDSLEGNFIFDTGARN